MPKIFRIGSYWVYFWSNEGDPIEPVHVHVSEGGPTSDATKVWITRDGACELCHNNSRIPMPALRNIMLVLEARRGEVVEKWRTHFGTVHYR